MDTFIIELRNKLEDLGYSSNCITQKICGQEVEILWKQLVNEYLRIEKIINKKNYEAFSQKFKSIAHSINLSEQDSLSESVMIDFCHAINCPYLQIQSDFMHLFLTDFIASELQTSRLELRRLISKHENEDIQSIIREIAQIIKVDLINVSEASSNDSSAMLQLCQGKFDMIIDNLNRCDNMKLATAILHREEFSDDDIKQIESINEVLKEDYQLRRTMLLKRCDITLQSFLWSDKIKGLENDFISKIHVIRSSLSQESRSLSLDEIFNASSEDLKIRRESSKSIDEASRSLKRVVIGSVPDRGGRTDEMRPKKSDFMPSWKERKDNNQQSNRGGMKKEGSTRHAKHGRKGFDRAKKAKTN